MATKNKFTANDKMIYITNYNLCLKSYLTFVKKSHHKMGCKYALVLLRTH